MPARVGVSPAEARPARPRRPEAGGGTTDLEDLTATRRRAWPSSSLPIVRLAVTASRAALRAVACDRLDVPRLDPATAHLGLAPTRKAGPDQTSTDKETVNSWSATCLGRAGKMISRCPKRHRNW